VRKGFLVTAVAAGALVLAGCGSGGGSGTAAGGSVSPAGSTAGSPAAQAGAELSTAKTSLGTVVVDGRGRTVYVFDKDTMGAAASACTGVCVGLWPELTTTSSAPMGSGVSGTVGTAPTTGGAKQITLDGHRLYSFSGDTQAGQVNGEAYMHQWWVLSPAGQLIKNGAMASSSSSYTGY
jgi:predicted lipoprotein with Yx(FWY)xxD motif